MNCEDIAILLDDHVDGELDEREREAVEAHLAACAVCRGTLDDLRDLQQAVAALPRGLAPRRDLLPGIREAALREEARGGSRRRATLRWAAAAAAVLILAATAWLGLRGTLGPVPSRTDAASTSPELLAADVALSEFEAAEIEYERATARLLQALEARQDDLSPGTREVVLENLKIIDRAIAEARAALEADPTDARNGHALNALHRQKVELLWRLSRISS